MARRRRKKSFLATLVSITFFGLAAFGGWTLYQQNEKEVKGITKKTVKTTKAVVKKFADKTKELVEQVDVPMTVGSEVWTCWFKPNPEDLKKCQENRKCSGAGVYSQHPVKSESIKLGAAKCAEEFGKCELEYCEWSNQ